VYRNHRSEGECSIGRPGREYLMMGYRFPAARSPPSAREAGKRGIACRKPTPARYEIVIPCQAPRVEIQVAGARVFLKQGARVSAPRAAGRDGGHLIPLTRP
jgi:hypothetical protein